MDIEIKIVKVCLAVELIPYIAYVRAYWRRLKYQKWGGKNLARIAGVDIPRNKRVEISLTYIFGIGKSTSNKILEKAGVDKDTRVKDLTEEQVAKIRNFVEEYKVEGELRKEIRLNIKRLLDIKSYRGLRHRNGLPVRGQKTKTNARTRKGPVKMAIAKKK